jgi:hypothetical protein
VFSDVMVARMKGAIGAGIPHKLVSHLTGASKSILGHYSRGSSRKDVAPDSTVVDKLREWLNGA